MSRESWYEGDGYEDMHLQGRWWKGRMIGFNRANQGPIFDAAPPLESYGVPHGSGGMIFKSYVCVCVCVLLICVPWSLVFQLLKQPVVYSV